MECATIHIPQFNGKEMEKWKIRVLSYFKKKGWSDLLTQSKLGTALSSTGVTTRSQKQTDATTAATGESNEDIIENWITRDNAAMDFLISKTSDEYLYIISNKTTTMDMWTAILACFEKTSESYTVELRKQVFEMRHDPKMSTLLEYLHEFIKKVESLATWVIL